jgi:molybdopterin-containing oxidoreductase family iron-sulfur binding subunit
VFGDLADSGSRVAQLAYDDRAYAILAELNVKPRTTYMAKIRNPHPDLAAEGAAGPRHGQAASQHGEEG